MVAKNWNGQASNRIGRRRMLRGAAVGAAGVTAFALAACGGGARSGTGTGSTSSSPSTGATSGSPAAGVGAAAASDLPWPYAFPEPSKTAKAGGVLKVADTWDVSILDPTKTVAAGTLTPGNLVYSRLLSFKTGPEVDPFKVEIGGELAPTWEQPDPTRYLFKLTPGIKYQDLPPVNGRAFKAEDIKYAYERYAKEGVSTSYFTTLDSINAIDDTTLEIKLKEVSADFIVYLSSRYLPIFPRELVEQGTIEKTAVGTGPMQIKEMVKSDHFSFEKNPNYWRGKVLLDGLEFRIMPDASARLAAFRAGQIGYGANPSTKREADDLVKSTPDVQINLIPADSAIYAIAMNLDNPKFQDERVRQAIALSMDRDTIIEVLYGKGLGKSLPSIPYDFVLDKEPAAAELGKWWKYDPAEAKKLLQAAGQANFTFPVIYYEYSPTANTRTLEILADQFRQSGITLQVQKADYTEFNSQWSGRGFKEAAHGWRPAATEADAFFYNHLHSKSPGNRWRINDAQIDEWATKQRAELDAKARRALHKQIWDRMQDKMYRPETPQAVPFAAYASWVRGLRFGGARNTNYSIYDWGQQIHKTWIDK